MQINNKQLLTDPDICSEIFVYLGMAGFDTPRIEQILKANAHSVMAGGCVANTILNIRWGREKFPINDVDIFILKNGLNTTVLETLQSKPDTTEEYLQIASPKLYMVDRREDKDHSIDYVYMSLDNRFLWDDETLEKINFPKYVINSFDLNCVEVGVFWNGKSFELIWNDTFEKFLNTAKVEVTNVHSMVTLPRAVKKSMDLKAYIDLKEEFEIIWYGCNSRNLNKLTTEQIEKHKEQLSFDNIVRYMAVLEHSQPLHDEVYQSFFDTKLMGNRRDKIRLLRFFRNDKHPYFCNPHPFYKDTTLYLASLYNGTLEEFFGKNIEHISYYSFITSLSEIEKFHEEEGFIWPLIGKTVDESINFIREYYRKNIDLGKKSMIE